MAGGDRRVSQQSAAARKPKKQQRESGRLCSRDGERSLRNIARRAAASQRRRRGSRRIQRGRRWSPSHNRGTRRARSHVVLLIQCTHAALGPNEPPPTCLRGCRRRNRPGTCSSFARLLSLLPAPVHPYGRKREAPSRRNLSGPAAPPQCTPSGCQAQCSPRSPAQPSAAPTWQPICSISAESIAHPPKYPQLGRPERTGPIAARPPSPPQPARVRRSLSLSTTGRVACPRISATGTTQNPDAPPMRPGHAPSASRQGRLGQSPWCSATWRATCTSHRH